MNSTAKIASLVALLVTIAPSVLFFLGVLEMEPMKWITLGGTVAWFAVTPTWMGRKTKNS